MKFNRLFQMAFILTGLLVYISCRKADSPLQDQPPFSKTSEDRFFNSHRSTDPTEKALVDFIKRRNAKDYFVEQTIKQIGYPRWDKALSFKKPATKSAERENAEDSVSISYIPFVRDSQHYVNALLIIKTQQTDTAFYYFCDWQYKSKVHGLPSIDTTAERYAIFFMILDNRTFGHTGFNITDTSLFPAAVPRAGGGKRLEFVNISSSGAARNNLWEYHEICVDFYVCGDPDWCARHGGCDYLNCVAGAGEPGHCYLVTSICDGWWEETGGSGGGTGGTGGTGGSGGGSGGGNTPPNCGGPITNSKGMILEGCQPGWNPGGGGGTPPPPPPDPIDSLLARYSRAIKDTAVYIYDNLSQPFNIEYAFTGTLQNGQIVPIEIRTNNDSIQVIPKVMIGRTILLFTWHSHVSRSINIAERGSFSPADIDMLRNVRCLTQGFVSFADCRDKRYALVVTDAVKATIFFNSNDVDAIDKNWVTNNMTGTVQEIDERRVKNVIGSTSVNGVSFYVSNDTPNFQTWTLLNQ
jgi:hypothetical protein